MLLKRYLHLIEDTAALVLVWSLIKLLSVISEDKH